MILPESPALVAASLYSRPGSGTTAAPAFSMSSLTCLSLSPPNINTFSVRAPSTSLNSRTQAGEINNSTPTPVSDLIAMTNIIDTPIPTLNGPFNALALINDTGSFGASQAPRELVQFYARVRTPNGFQAIALDPSLFTGLDVNLIHKYAVWKQEEVGTGMSLSYEQFCKVVGFAKMKVEE